MTNKNTAEQSDQLSLLLVNNPVLAGEMATVLDRHDLVSIADVSGIITYVNKNFCDVSGYNQSELIGQNHRILKSEHHSQEFYTDLWATISKGKIWRGTVCNKKKDGSDYWVESIIVPFNNENGRPYQYVSARTEVSKIKIAEEEALNANRAKSEFLSSMSHELRTPLNAILGFSQLLQMTPEKLDADQKQSVDEIFKAGKHLLGLINEVLDLAKIEAGHINLSIEPVCCVETLEECLPLIAILAKNRNIKISIMLDGNEIQSNDLRNSDCIINADRTRLKQSLLNLLSNAIKYNKENGDVIISFDSVSDDKIRINVTDNGLGISPENHSNLFKSFKRLGAESSKVEGIGIGLVITKSIIEKMGGSIGVQSTQGKGSTFWIELPRAKLPLKNIQNEKLKETSQIHKMNLTGLTKTILYIEDNPSNLNLVKQIFSHQPNIKLCTAHEPLLGMELSLTQKPDLILLDINLPGIDGYEVLKQLRLRNETTNTPVIAISANAMTRDIKKGLAAGFDDYITKPIVINDLLDSVDTLLKNRDL